MHLSSAESYAATPRGKRFAGACQGASYELPEAAARTKNFPEIKIFLTACRIPVWPFVVIVKAGN
jgi:hypothetical protein